MAGVGKALRLWVIDKKVFPLGQVGGPWLCLVGSGLRSVGAGQG